MFLTTTNFAYPCSLEDRHLKNCVIALKMMQKLNFDDKVDDTKNPVLIPPSWTSVVSRGDYRFNKLNMKQDAPPRREPISRGCMRGNRILKPFTINNDFDYFKSYDHLSIHREMLQDEIRTWAFHDAIMENKHYFKDKVIMDVGCGTGILSLFAAKAGAALVIGIDASNVIDLAQKVVKDQAPEIASRIVFIKSKVEDINELPKGIEKVDVIISEWMGYCLLFESMLETVLYARDKWLKPDGLMFPNKVSLFGAGMKDRKRRDLRQSWWYDVYGFNFTAMQKLSQKVAIVEQVDPRKIVTDDVLLKEFDLYNVQNRDLAFTAPFKIKMGIDSEIQAFVTFFTVEFSHCHRQTRFSTSMDKPLTHWKQTVFYLTENFMVHKNDEIMGEFILRPKQQNQRQLDFQIILNHIGYNKTYYTKEDFFMV